MEELIKNFVLKQYLNLNNDLNVQKIYKLLPKQIIGIPFEYSNGIIKMKFEGCFEVKKFSIYKDFLLIEVENIDIKINNDNDEIYENEYIKEKIKNIKNKYIFKEFNNIIKYFI